MRYLSILLALLTGLSSTYDTAAADQHPYDLGEQDSVYLVLSEPEYNGNAYTFCGELFFFNDAQTVGAASMGMYWDNPDVFMDSAVCSAEAIAAFDFVKFVYRDNSIDSTNLYRQFQFAASRIFSTGLQPSPLARHMATYYFRIPYLAPEGAVCIDTAKFSTGTSFVFVDQSHAWSYAPFWGGMVCACEVVGCVTVDTLLIDGEASADNVVDNVPHFVWTYADSLGFQQSEFEIAVGTDRNWTSAEMWEPSVIVSSDTSVQYAGAALLDGGTYYIRLRLGDGFEWTRWYETAFRMNTIPAIPSVLSPADGGISGLVPELWITNSSDAENDTLTYDFELYMDLAMQWIIKDTQGVLEQPDSTGWNTGGTLTDNEPFWWRARSYDGYEYSEWSDLSVFWVNGTQQPPTAPETILPPDTSGLPVWDMLPTFYWSEASDPDPFDTVFYHRLEVSPDSNFTFVFAVDSIWDNSYALEDSLAFATHYWWRVSACDATDLCSTSEPGNFWTWTLGDMDHTHEADITDLSILIDNQFLTLTPIYPAFVGDVTGDCQIDITDISRFIDHLFLTLGPLEVGCE